MAMQAPTRITIEVHPPAPGAEWQQPRVRVVPAGEATSQPHAVGMQSAPAPAQAREEVLTPAAYEPGPCLCLDDEDCGADHANE
jgi:hypothetical protein